VNHSARSNGEQSAEENAKGKRLIHFAFPLLIDGDRGYR